MYKHAFLLAAGAALVAPAHALNWMNDAEAAMRLAKSQHKLVLVSFTGSDWCRSCIRLRSQVFDQADFEAFAKEKFVFLEVDCPRTKKLPDKLSEQNQALCRKYSISSFPTVLVLTPKGDVVGGFGGYQNLEEVQNALNKSVRNASDIRAAKKLPENKQKAALASVYNGMESVVRRAGGYKAEDGDTAARQRAELDAKLRTCRNAKEMKKVLSKAAPGILPANRQFYLQRYYTVLLQTAETAEDLATARKIGEELLSGMPAPYNEQFKAQMDANFADPAAYLEKLKAERQQKQK